MTTFTPATPIATINGQTLQLVAGSLQITDTIGQRSTCQFTAYEIGTSTQYDDGDPLVIVDSNGNTIYGGFVDTDEARQIGQGTAVQHTIVGADNHRLADKRRAALAYTGWTTDAIANDIIAQVLGYEGVYAVKNLLGAQQSEALGLWNNVSATDGGVILSQLATHPVAIPFVCGAGWLGGMDTAVGATPYEGTTAIRVQTYGGVSAQGVRIVAPVARFFAGVSYVASAYVQGSGNVTIAAFRSDTSAVLATSAIKTLTGSWQRISIKFTAPSPLPSTGGIGLQVRLNGAAVAVFYVDAAQIEPAPVSPTPWEVGQTSTIQAGPTVTQFTCNYDTMAACLDALAQFMAVGYWYIDANRRLTLAYPGYVSGPAANTTLDDVIQRDTDYAKRQKPLYRNNQYLLGGTDVTATQTETRQGDGKTRAFTLSYPVASASVPVITLNSVAQTVGIKGKDSGKQFYYAVGDPVIAQDTSGTLLTSSDTLQVVYQGTYPIVVQSQSAGEVATQAALEATSGLVDDMIEDTSIKSSAQAFQAGAAVLSRFATRGAIFTFTTPQPGYAAGQQVSVTAPIHGLNNTLMLVESVTITDIAPLGTQYPALGYLWYTVVCVYGPVDQSWVQYFGALTQKSGKTDTINLGSSATLVIFQQFTAALALAASFTATVTACPICAAGLLCGPSVIVC